MPHYVASDLDLHCLPFTLLRVSGKNGLRPSINDGPRVKRDILLCE